MTMPDAGTQGKSPLQKVHIHIQRRLVIYFLPARIMFVNGEGINTFEGPA